MIDMFGEVGVEMGCFGIVWGELGLEGRWGRYSLRASNIYNVKDKT